MKQYQIKAALHSYSCEFEIEAESLGLALRAADDEFRRIYCDAIGHNPTDPIVTWADHKVSAKEIKTKT